MQARRFPEDDYLALKSAVRRSRKLAGPRGAISEQTRVGSTQIANYEDARQADCHIPIDVAMDLDELAGEDVILAQMAALKNYRLTPCDPIASCSDMKCQTASFLKEAGEALTSLSPDNMTPNQLDEAISEVQDVVSICWGMLNELHAQKVRAVA